MQNQSHPKEQQPTAAQTSLYVKIIFALLLVASGLWLMGPFGAKIGGWTLLVSAAVIVSLWGKGVFRWHSLLLLFTLAFLGITPVNTNVDIGHMLTMGTVLAIVVAVPYYVTRRRLHEKTITFPFRFGRKWRAREIAYLCFAVIAAYFLLPYYLADTGSYLNWSAPWDPSSITRLFIGTNVLGIWDEIFFVGVCLALLRQHYPFVWANCMQALLWAAFLYELGFRGWGPIPIFIFAVSQGYLFRYSKSMLYVVVVHLSIDFLLFLSILHLHNPDHLRIFVTSPF